MNSWIVTDHWPKHLQLSFETDAMMQEYVQPHSQAMSFRHMRVYEANKDHWTYISMMNPTGRPHVLTTKSLLCFIQVLESAAQIEASLHFIMLLRSGGVKFNHPRSIVDKVWAVVPWLYRIRDKHLLSAIAFEKCLGAVAVYFAQADYRLVAGEQTLINLTGPGVIKNFFGKEKDRPYEQYASALHQFKHNELIQELYPSLTLAMERVNNLNVIKQNQDLPGPIRGQYGFNDHTLTIKHQEPINPKSYQWTEEFVHSISDQYYQLFPQLAQIAPVYLIRIEGSWVGMLMQLIDNPYNLIHKSMVRKWEMALKIFKALKIPLISSIDAPGIDPRSTESDHNLLLSSVDLVEKLVHYPFPKIGLFAGRGFGGSSVFTLLKVHGSMRFYAFKEAKLGIMSDAVLDRVCANHPKHLKDWEETKKIHRSDMSDLVEAGVIDQVLQRSEFRSVIVRDLLSQPHYIPKQENKGYPHGINPQ